MGKREDQVRSKRALHLPRRGPRGLRSANDTQAASQLASNSLSESVHASFHPPACDLELANASGVAAGLKRRRALEAQSEPVAQKRTHSVNTASVKRLAPSMVELDCINFTSSKPKSKCDEGGIDKSGVTGSAKSGSPQDTESTMASLSGSPFSSCVSSQETQTFSPQVAWPAFSLFDPCPRDASLLNYSNLSTLRVACLRVAGLSLTVINFLS